MPDTQPTACPDCGTTYVPDAAFCAQCGTPRPNDDAADPKTSGGFELEAPSEAPPAPLPALGIDPGARETAEGTRAADGDTDTETDTGADTGTDTDEATIELTDTPPPEPAPPEPSVLDGPSDGTTVRMQLSDVVSAWEEDGIDMDDAAFGAGAPSAKRARLKRLALAALVVIAVLAVIVFVLGS